MIANNNGSLYLQDTVAARDGTRSLAGVTRMMFTDGTGVFDPTGTAENVARLYDAALRRPPDSGGVAYWTNQVDDAHVPLSTVASYFIASPEFIQRYGPLSDAGFVDQLYRNVLGRAADPGGAQYWTASLASGTGRGSIVLGFAESPENLTRTLPVAGDVKHAEAYRLYQSALGRQPDAGGLAYWSAALAGGTTPTQVALQFVNSPEFESRYGSLGVNDFITVLYQNVFHRTPEAGGLAYWVGKLQQGETEAGVVLGFSDSLENRVQTAAATHADWLLIPGSG